MFIDLTLKGGKIEVRRNDKIRKEIPPFRCTREDGGVITVNYDDFGDYGPVVLLRLIL